MRTIVIANLKGGCGKTTTAVNLTAALAQMDVRVLIIDLDPQAHATLTLGHDPEAVDKTIYRSLTSEQIAISRFIVSSNIEGLDLVPSNRLLTRFDLQPGIVHEKEFTLREQLKTVSNEYDMCIIDCPPSFGLLNLTRNALVASTDVIVPVQTHYYSLKSLKHFLEIVDDTRKRFPTCSVTILGLLLTFVQSKVVFSQKVEQQMRESLGDLVFNTVIHKATSLTEASSASASKSISTSALTSRGADEYRALAEEVTDKLIENIS